MKCLYINLDRETGRRERIEANFARVPHHGWTLERFAAVDGQRDAASLPPGKCRPSQKACMLSHTGARRLAAASGEPTLIVEDDCLFHEQTFSILDQLLRSQAAGWDMLFLDVGIPPPAEMIALFRLRREWATSLPGTPYRGPVRSIDLAQFNFVGAAAYVVAPRCAQALVNTVTGLADLDVANDMLLRSLIRGGQIKAQTAFPFLTTQADDADLSANQLPAHQLTDFLWNSFRRLVWIGADSGAVGESLRHRLPPDHVDRETQVLQQILGGCLSSNFFHK